MNDDLMINEWIACIAGAFIILWCAYELMTLPERDCKLEYTGREICVEWEGGSAYRNEIAFINLEPKIVSVPNKCVRKEKKERLVCR